MTEYGTEKSDDTLVMIGTWIPKRLRTQLRVHALQRDTSVRRVVTDALLDALYRKALKAARAAKE